MTWRNLDTDIPLLTPVLVPSSLGPGFSRHEWRLHDPHPAADAFIRDRDRGDQVAVAARYIEANKGGTDKEVQREILRCKAVIYNASNRARINQRQRARDAAKRKEAKS